MPSSKIGSRRLMGGGGWLRDRSVSAGPDRQCAHDHVVRATLTLGKGDHDETNAEDDRGDGLAN